MNQPGFFWDIPYEPMSPEERATGVSYATAQVSHHEMLPLLWVGQPPQFAHIHPFHRGTQSTQPVLIPHHTQNQHSLPHPSIDVRREQQAIQLMEAPQPTHVQPMFPAVELLAPRSQLSYRPGRVQVYMHPVLIQRYQRQQQQAGRPQFQAHPAGPHNLSYSTGPLNHSQPMCPQYHTHHSCPHRSQIMGPHYHFHTTGPQNLSQPTGPQNLSQPTGPQNLSQPTGLQNQPPPTGQQRRSQPARVQSEQDRQRQSDQLLQFSRLIISLVNFLNRTRDETRVVDRILARSNTHDIHETEVVHVAPAA